MRIGPILAVIVIAGNIACADDEAAAFGEHDIEGTVVDEFSEAGISGAKIEFLSDTLDRAETTSTSDGRFTLSVEVPDGVKFGTLQASKSGYTDSAKLSVYFDGAAVRTELKLRPKN